MAKSGKFINAALKFQIFVRNLPPSLSSSRNALIYGVAIGKPLRLHLAHAPSVKFIPFMVTSLITDSHDVNALTNIYAGLSKLSESANTPIVLHNLCKYTRPT